MRESRRGKRWIAQHIKVVLHAIELVHQWLDVSAQRAFMRDGLNARFHAVRQLAQAHGASQTGTAFEGVQTAQHFAARAHVVGAGGPLTQRSGCGWEQLLGLFFENFKQIRINRVNRINLVVQLIHIQLPTLHSKHRGLREGALSGHCGSSGFCGRGRRSRDCRQ